MIDKRIDLPSTRGQTIYNYLKDAIFNNQLKANEEIEEKEIAEFFQVSLTPVREAVLRLGAEGFVDINSYKKAMVKKVSYKELVEILQVVRSLEALTANLVLDNIEKDDIKVLEKIIAKMEHCFQKKSLEKYIYLDSEFHNKIWASLPSFILQKTLTNVYGQLLRYNYARIAGFKRPGVLKKSLDGHKKILDTLRKRDEKKLKVVLSIHWGPAINPSMFKEALSE